MSGLKRILLLVVLFLVFLIGSVYAGEGKVEIVKNFEKIEPGKIGIVELKLTSTDKLIVGIKMKIKGNENIEITEVKSSSEIWNLTAYNPANGLAVLTNTNGAESGSIIKIFFKVKEDTKAKETSISVENFEVSSNEYDYVKIANISTKIDIEQPKTSVETEQLEQLNQEESNKILVAGVLNYVIILIVLVSVIGVICYTKYKRID